LALEIVVNDLVAIHALDLRQCIHIMALLWQLCGKQASVWSSWNNF